MAQISLDQIQVSHLGAAVARILEGFHAVATELRGRIETTNSLCNLSSRQLRDIGLIRADIDAAGSAPLSQDAATELWNKARLRSGNW